MAMQRPNVVVYQEYSALTIIPDPADLEVLIVGPCYQILDYADDKAACYADEYGTLNVNNPLSAIPALVIATPPNAKPGAVLDADATYVYLDEARVVITSWALNADAVYADGDNLFAARDNTAGANFEEAGVAPGDILITASSGTTDLVRTVKEVVAVLTDIAPGTLNFLAGGGGMDAVQAGDTVILESDQVTASRNGSYTVKRVRSDTELEFAPQGWEQHWDADVAGKTTTITVVSPAGTVRAGYPVLGAELANYSDVRLTQDFTESAPAGYEWRVERNVNNIELDAADITIVGNQITVKADVTVDLSPVLVDLPVSYAKAYVQYMALRTDLQKITPMGSYASMVAEMGKYDARNPLMVGATVAKANTSTGVNVYGVVSNDLPGYLDFIDRISSERNVYAIVPLAYNNSVIAAINNNNNVLADPTEVLARGIKQKFRVCIGAVELPLSKELVPATGGGYTAKVSATAPTGNYTLVVGGVGAALVNWTAFTGLGRGIIPGDVITVTDGVEVSTYTAVHVNSATHLEVSSIAAGTMTLIADDTVSVTAADGTLATVILVAAETLTLTPAVLDDLYLTLTSPTATFISDGVIPGDYLDIPNIPGGGIFETGTYGTWIIDQVETETRVRVMNRGNNTVVLENELPHYYTRQNCTFITGGQIYYRVRRANTKNQQVDDMVSVALSFGSKRLVLCFPSSVEVADLVDGSLPRTGTAPAAAMAQPGYYLSCAVGGQTAGLPSHQGFTNMGIAGISRVYNTTGYFTEEQLSDLSNGGVYVFVQDTNASLPYSIHEVTTDVSALEFGEYMVTKNFDYIAWTFLDTLRPFIGPWNVLPSTIEFIRQALIDGGDNMKGQYRAKIGAPLTDYSIDNVDVSDFSKDRIEAFVDVDLPMVLNTIGLHLVA